jgi:hypothetical protein
MTRYKRRTSPKAIERDFPHIVETIVPLGGFGKRLDNMYAFHSLHGLTAQRGQGRREASNRWCFADSETAEAFASEFGGSGLPRRGPI